ncbi:hypothetical protein C8D95_101306 [Silicimonas algicola]|uniref:Uncharacterized protein n=2 Tax=Silicimonas algicola TaxID=1826607 RepID=A0A316GCS5_9RHOB|nr:hypothetical protein C8D95_101306 [Silicimonas algicola]
MMDENAKQYIEMEFVNYSWEKVLEIIVDQQASPVGHRFFEGDLVMLAKTDNHGGIEIDLTFELLAQRTTISDLIDFLSSRHSIKYN